MTSTNNFIDQTTRISFKFNGQQLFGYRGDTLASALLSNNIHLVGRSFKYHRPRGIMTCGSEEPNAIIQVGNDFSNLQSVKNIATQFKTTFVMNQTRLDDYISQLN